MLNPGLTSSRTGGYLAWDTTNDTTKGSEMATSRTLLVSAPRRAPRPEGAAPRPLDRDGFPVLTPREIDILEFLYEDGISVIPSTRDVSAAWRHARTLELFGLVEMTPDRAPRSGEYGPYKVPQHHTWTLVLSPRGEQCMAARIARTMPDTFPRNGRK